VFAFFQLNFRSIKANKHIRLLYLIIPRGRRPRRVGGCRVGGWQGCGWVDGGWVGSRWVDGGWEGGCRVDGGWVGGCRVDGGWVGCLPGRGDCRIGEGIRSEGVGRVSEAIGSNKAVRGISEVVGSEVVGRIVRTVIVVVVVRQCRRNKDRGKRRTCRRGSRSEGAGQQKGIREVVVVVKTHAIITADRCGYKQRVDTGRGRCSGRGTKHRRQRNGIKQVVVVVLRVVTTSSTSWVVTVVVTVVVVTVVVIVEGSRKKEIVGAGSG